MTIDQLFFFTKVSVWTLLLGSKFFPILIIVKPPNFLRSVHVILRAFLAICVVHGLTTAYHHFVTLSVYHAFHQEYPGLIVEGQWVAILWGSPSVTVIFATLTSFCVLGFYFIVQFVTNRGQNKPATASPISLRVD